MILTRNLLSELDLGILIFYFNKIKILLICRFTVRHRLGMSQWNNLSQPLYILTINQLL